MERKILLCQNNSKKMWRNLKQTINYTSEDRVIEAQIVR